MRRDPDDFHVLDARLRLRGTLQLETALHIGGGSASDFDATDMPVLRDFAGRPLIPGASLKGVVRSTAEGLVRAVQKGNLWACNPLQTDPAHARQRAPNPGLDPLACGMHGEKYGDKDREGALEQLHEHCALCRVFGSRVLSSHVRFSDALLVDHDDDAPLPVELRDGVAIDRDLRTVHPGQKYDFDVVSPGTRFGVEIFVENPQGWLMGLLMVAFDQIDEGFSAVGGFTSRGLGRVRLRWHDVTEFTAHQLLAGEDPVVWTADDLTARRAIWRKELAAEMGGD